MAVSRRSTLPFTVHPKPYVVPVRSALKRLTVRPTMPRRPLHPFLLLRIDATEEAFIGSGKSD
jgi:hypothetical protein